MSSTTAWPGRNSGSAILKRFGSGARRRTQQHAIRRHRLGRLRAKRGPVWLAGELREPYAHRLVAGPILRGAFHAGRSEVIPEVARAVADRSGRRRVDYRTDLRRARAGRVYAGPGSGAEAVGPVARFLARLLHQIARAARLGGPVHDH